MPRYGEGIGIVLHSPQASICPQGAAQIRDVHLAFGCNRPLLLQGYRPKQAPGGTTGQDLTMVQVASPATHIRLFLTTLELLVLLLFIVPTSFYVYLSYFSNTYFLLL